MVSFDWPGHEARDNSVPSDAACLLSLRQLRLEKESTRVEILWCRSIAGCARTTCFSDPQKLIVYHQHVSLTMRNN
jgi:hypothetical protein